MQRMLSVVVMVMILMDIVCGFVLHFASAICIMQNMFLYQM